MEDEDESPPSLQINLNGRRCGTLDFSKGAAHSCCIYDKTKEITVSRKDWMHEVWRSNGWDGESRVTRVEFRYKRECLREMGVEEAYAFLDQTPLPLGVLHQAVAAAHHSYHGPQQGALAHLATLGGGAAGDVLW